MRSGLVLLVLVPLLLVPLPVAGQDDIPESVLRIDTDGHAHAQDGGIATVRSEVPGRTYTIDLVLGAPYSVLEVRVEGGIDIARPLQLVPEVDDSAQHPDAEHLHPHFFVPVTRDVTVIDEPAHIVNVTGSGATFTMRLGLIGPGTSSLTLTRDVEAPFYQIDDPTDITHFSFITTTRTDEYAYGDLRIRKANDTSEIENPTPAPSLEQTFPVQGLDPNTTYTYRFVFTDWAGNRVSTEDQTVRTLPAPPVSDPIVESREPAPGSVAAPGDRIAATFRSPTPITLDGASFFLDKVPTPDGLGMEAVLGTPDGYTIVYKPGVPATPGPHHVRIEATNADGARGTASWSFVVGEATTETSPGMDALGITVVGLAALATIRRAQSGIGPRQP